MAPVGPLRVYWWLSFADAKAFRGVCIVRSEQTPGHAIQEAIAQKCNVVGADVKPVQLREGIIIDPTFLNRLLTLEEATYLNAVFKAKPL